jgi:hypothetical protein
MCFVTGPPAAYVWHGGEMDADVGHKGSSAAVDTTKVNSGADPAGAGGGDRHDHREVQPRDVRRVWRPSPY